MIFIALYYKFVCHYIFRLGHQVEIEDSPALTGMRALSNNPKIGLLCSAIVVAVFMSIVLALAVYIYPRSTNSSVDMYALSVFATLFILFHSIYGKTIKKRKWAGLVFVTELALAYGCTRLMSYHRNWLMNDICMLLGGIAMLEGFKRITLKQAIVLCFGIMMYDVIAVFGSGHMLELAKLSDSSPVSPDGSSTNIVFGALVIPDKLSISAKSLFMIGLGDIVTPGLLIMSAYKLYTIRGLNYAVIGYCLGMIVSTIALICFEKAQPATIYLIPCTLIGIWFASGKQSLLTIEPK